MKEFNVTGLCVPWMHYMVDISGKVAQIREMINARRYFTINRARQYGKTTMLEALKQALKDEYIVASISFEGLGDAPFASEDAFCSKFPQMVKTALGFTFVDADYINKWDKINAKTFDQLSDNITALCKGNKIILMIDEVDKASNNRVFLHFLSMLRSKFLARQAGEDHTFHSVILAGVYDIKNIKLKMVQEGSYVPDKAENKIYNSPWNIAVSFKVDLSFNPDEIASMLEAYERDFNTGMDIISISKEIYLYTNGYPFLVSRICQCIAEEMDALWTAEGVRAAIQMVIREQNTLFDDISKNLENDENLYKLIYDILIVGEQKMYSINNPTINLAVMYGILVESAQSLIVANKIFEQVISDYFISKDQEKDRKSSDVLQYDVVKDGKFDMELCLRKFAEHYAEIFSDRDVSFYERHGRLLFLSYLKPLLNGRGYYHIESQFTDTRRMDIVVDFGQQQFIIELKVWRGVQYQSDAYQQLADYLECSNKDEGYLLTFDFRKKRNKAHKAGWLEKSGKRIFEVVV